MTKFLVKHKKSFTLFYRKHLLRQRSENDSSVIGKYQMNYLYKIHYLFKTISPGEYIYMCVCV
jgi:hypothetical protein